MVPHVAAPAGPCLRWALPDGTEGTFVLGAPEVSIGRKSESIRN